MKDKSIFIAYKENNIPGFATTNMTLEEWKKSNPHLYVVRAFYVSADIAERTDKMEADFLSHCDWYGLSRTDLGRIFKHPKTCHPVKLVGYNPRNKKYVFIIEDQYDKKQYKVMPRFVTNNINIAP